MFHSLLFGEGEWVGYVSLRSHVFEAAGVSRVFLSGWQEQESGDDVFGLRFAAAINFIFPEVQGPAVVPGFPEVTGNEIPVVIEAVEGVGDMNQGITEAAFVPPVLEPGVLPDHVFASAEHGKESAPQGFAKDVSPFGVLPFAAGEAALGRVGVLHESLLCLSQPQKGHGQFFVGQAQPEKVSAFMNAAVTDSVGHPADDLLLGPEIIGHFGGNHSDLVLVGPGHELIRFCHKKTYFKELHRPPGRSRQGTIPLPSGPSSVVVEIRACYGL